MSNKPDGTKEKKPTKASVYKSKSEKPMKREAKAQAIKVYRMDTGLATERGTARAKRRQNGDLTPVNKEASLAQHPDGKYAKSLMKPKSKAIQEIEKILAAAGA